MIKSKSLKILQLILVVTLFNFVFYFCVCEFGIALVLNEIVLQGMIISKCENSLNITKF